MKYTINTYDINGKHTALDSNNKPLLFSSEAKATSYLINEVGVSTEYIQEKISIEVASELEVQGAYVPSVII